MRTSKYLGMKSGNWTCTHVGIAYINGAFYKGTRKRTAFPGHQTYYYIFERPTSDNKAEKLIRLNAAEARKVWIGEVTVEELVQKRVAKKTDRFTSKVSYHFFK
jgi:hypothetical protein